MHVLHFRHTLCSCYTQTTCTWRRGCCVHTCRCRWSFRPLLNMQSPLKHDFYFCRCFFSRLRLRLLMIWSNARIHVAMVELHAADWLVWSLNQEEKLPFLQVYSLKMFLNYLITCKLQTRGLKEMILFWSKYQKQWHSFTAGWGKRKQKLITGSLTESSSLVPCCVFHTALRPPALASGVKLHRKSMC